MRKGDKAGALEKAEETLRLDPSDRGGKALLKMLSQEK
jgi:hypothetical protein